MLALTLVADRNTAELELEVERAAKLRAQWPKRHRCSLEQPPRTITQEAYAELPLRLAWSDQFAAYESRECPGCGASVLAVTKLTEE